MLSLPKVYKSSRPKTFLSKALDLAEFHVGLTVLIVGVAIGCIFSPDLRKTLKGLL